MTAASNKSVRVVVVAICGYGASYVRELLDAPAERGAELVGAVDPYANCSGLYDELVHRGVPIFADLAAFYASGAADLVVIASPIHHHRAQTLTALANGSGVLCEKPAAATIQDVREMAAAAEAAGLPVAIGFQRSFSAAVRNFKRDILAGRFGRAKRFKALICWPRAESYYRRNDWAGRLKADDGAWVLDSPVNNATAHFLHHMLYLLGPAPDQSATPVEVQAELYRAKPIESFDTGAIRVRTDSGAEIVFLTTHSTRKGRGPVLHYEFEHATATKDADGDKSIVVELADGERIDYGDPEADHFNKLWQMVEAVRAGGPVDCPVEAAMAHTLCVNGAHESGRIVSLPADATRTDDHEGSPLVWAPGLMETLESCFDQGALPSELGGVSWAGPGRVINLRDYKAFRGF